MEVDVVDGGGGGSWKTELLTIGAVIFDSFWQIAFFSCLEDPGFHVGIPICIDGDYEKVNKMAMKNDEN